MIGETYGDLAMDGRIGMWIGLKRLRTFSGYCVSVNYSRIS